MDEFLRFLEGLGIRLPESAPDRLTELHGLLVRANREVNLTRITSFEDYLWKHVADSLLAAAAFPPLGSRPLRGADVGCGAGFPALPLAIAFPGLRIRAIDSTARKIDRVREFIAALSLTNCDATAGRARELGRTEPFREAFDVVVARAVSGTADLIRECRALLGRPGGVLLAYKTPTAVAAEREEVLRSAARAGLEARASDEWSLPADRGDRQFWILRR